MAAIEANDLPDLDMLINAADNGSGLVSSSGEGSYTYADKDGFDPDEYAGVVQWYNKQTQNLQQHYDTHLEYQKQKLAEENEAGLLEALQQSLNNFESDHLSDFACLSSSLDNPIPVSTANNVLGSLSRRIPAESKSLEKPSMLKKLLLSPSNENYPKEIDSASSIDSLFGETRSNVSSPSQGSSSGRDDDIVKLQVTKRKKPFTELLKHMEATENDSRKIINVEDIDPRQTKQSNTTRLLNTKRYMKKYGSSPNSQEEPLTKKPKKKKSRVVLQPTVSAVATSTANNIGSPHIKNYTLSLNPKSPLESVNSPKKTKTNVSSLPVKNYWASVASKGDKTEPRTSKECKRQAEKSHGDICTKKARVAMPAVVLTNSRSCDHDYCEAQSEKNIPISPADPGDNAEKQSSNFTQPKDPPLVSQSKQAIQKVLKWEDYLRQVRSGTRSAPNSPTCSPKVARGSARVPNNFMVVSLHGPSSPASKVFITTVADKRNKNISTKVDKTVPLPKPLRKNVVNKQPLQGLQEFDKYISGLKTNINSTTSTTKSTAVVSTSSNVTAIPITVVSSLNLTSNNTKPCVLSTVAEQKGDEKSQCKAVTVKPRTKSQLLQVGNSMRILQTSINSDKTINVTSRPVTGSSGQMLMIQVPTTVSRPQPVPVTCKLVNKSIKPSALSTATQKTVKKKVSGTTETAKRVFGGSDEPKDPRDKHATYTPVKDLKLPAMMANCMPKEKPVTEKPDASPTFKLVTSNKDGVETKSLILSGVTGQLKEILTLMAKQQAVKQSEKGSPQSSLENKKQQQDTLEKLLSVISALKQTDSSKQSSASAGTMLDKDNPQHSDSQKDSMPSPLTLIHEIKQTFNKRKPSEIEQDCVSSTISKPPQEELTVGQSEQIIHKETTSSADQSHTDTDFATVTKTAASKSETVQSGNKIECNVDLKETEVNKNRDYDRNETTISTSKTEQLLPLSGGIFSRAENVTDKVTKTGTSSTDELLSTGMEKLPTENEVCLKHDLVKIDEDNVLETRNVQTKVPQEPVSTQVSISDNAIVNSVLNSNTTQSDGAVHNIMPGTTDSTTVKEPSASQIEPNSITLSNKQGEIKNVASKEKPRKFSMARSMAAAEMLASDIFDDGMQEILLFDKAKEKSSSIDVNNNNSTSAIDDPDPAVITLEDAMASLENDNLLGQNDEDNTALSTADRLFCKLPSYFLTGKVISEDKVEDEIEGLKQRGMKNVLCDPLINADDKRENNTEWEFNKLPHYFSSGKTRPNRITNSGGRGRPQKKSRKNSDLAVKLTSVDETKHITPQGAAVNAMETYYSRLPTYYTYGRPHLDVKTFNDDVADAKDDTVTTEILAKDKQGNEHSKSKRKRKTKKKKKHKKHKHKSKTTEKETSDKVLYSKIPSYYMSGRVLASQVTNMTCRLSPCRSPSFRSSSPDSLYYSSRSSRSGSRSRRSRSRSRRSRSHSRSGRSRNCRRRSLPYDRSYSSSRSSSRSSSYSDNESRRSWRRERRFRRSDRRRSSDRRSYDSTDEEDDYRSRREREAWKERRQYQEEREKKQQKAMEERRVVYVGRIDVQTTKQELRRRFMRFGNIETVSLHFRQNSDNYGFVTFQYSTDAFQAIEEGNSAFGPGEPQYDICFGGRRQFCKIEYEDLDSKAPDTETKNEELDDFDALLRQARRGLHR